MDIACVLLSYRKSIGHHKAAHLSMDRAKNHDVMENPMRPIIWIVSFSLCVFGAACSGESTGTDVSFQEANAEGALGEAASIEGSSDGVGQGEDGADNNAASDAEARPEGEGAWTDELDVPGTEDEASQEIAWQISLAGMVYLDTREGGLTVEVDDPESGERLCELTQDLTGMDAPESPCDPCSFAYVLYWGEPELQEGDPELCLSEAIVQGALHLGHEGPDQLFVGEDSGWDAQGTSSFQDPLWIFNMSTSTVEDEAPRDDGEWWLDEDEQGDDADDDAVGGEVDEDCFETCMQKPNASEEACAQGCMDKGDESGDDEGKDEDEGKDDDADDGKGDDADDGKGDGGAFEEVPCDDGFDPTAPCEGDAFSSACVYGGEWYWCENGAWTSGK